ncbi:MAG: ribbon-helix-helix protein, CopG family [Planctomycetes bacterium]|nr:ribbon-helix-helix protein, CopG family [Planctomycetota bacterium]MBI3833467.1 ribbon-helix-helix protein, CopG family [Planctomycetota bacterium]
MVSQERLENVTIRLPQSVRKRVEERAAAQHLSRSDCLRTVIVDSLERQENDAERLNELVKLRASVLRLREDLATVAAALLARAGKVSKAEAERWVREKLLSV